MANPIIAPIFAKYARAIRVVLHYFLAAMITVMPLSSRASAQLQCASLFAEPEAPSGLSKKVAAFVSIVSGGIVTLMPLAAWAGGFSGVGGGVGVAEGAHLKDTQLLRQFLEQKKPVPKDLLARFKLRTLDRWEMEKKQIELMDIPRGASWETILEMAKANIRLVAPTFGRRLDQVAEWMAFSDWQEFSGMGRVPDASTRFNLNENETPIQLVIRFSDGNNERSMGPATGKVRLKVAFNKPVFDLLDPIDQAMLVLHEQLYALAQSAGINSSDRVRPFVYSYFSKYMQEVRDYSQNGMVAARAIPLLKSEIIKLFGTYPMFFSDLDAIDKGAPRSVDRHFRIFIEVMTEQEKRFEQCTKAGGAGQACADQTLNETMARNDLSDEKAFIFLTYFLLERAAGSFNAEFLTDNKRSAREIEEAFKVACAQLQEMRTNIPADNPVLMGALRYCR